MQEQQAFTEESISDESTNPQDESFIEERKEIIEELFEKIEGYLKTNVSLFKLKAIDKIAGMGANIVSSVALFFLFILFFIMLNIGIAMWIGSIMLIPYAGFMIVAGFYLVLTILYLMFGKKMMKKSIGSSIIRDLTK